MENQLDQLDPILDQFIKTVDKMFPNNKGFIICIGLNNDNILTTNVGGNGRTTFGTAAKLLLDINHYVGDYFGHSGDKNPKL